MPHSPTDPALVQRPDPVLVHATLTGKLQSLTADEWSEVQGMIERRGETFVLDNWNLLLEQLRYIQTL